MILKGTLQEALSLTSTLLNKKIEEILPICLVRKNTVLGNNKVSSGLEMLIAAMRHLLVPGGKILRPLLVIEVSRLLHPSMTNSIMDEVVTAALAIELIHTYSLIHDDLPAMDDDDYRRGMPSCHKKFGEGLAILAGDALLTYSFQILSSLNLDANIRCEIMQIITKAIGIDGMIGGQVLDIENIKKADLSLDYALDIAKMKTAALFIASCEVGCVLSGANQLSRSLIRQYAANIGLAFQIMDDIIDNSLNEDTEVLRVELQKILRAASDSISVFGDDAKILKEIGCFILERSYNAIFGIHCANV